MAKLNLTGIDKILDEWNRAKGLEEATKKNIMKYRAQVEAFLVKARATDLNTGKYKVQKRLQSREGISKKDVPVNIWAQYAKESEFTLLAFTAFTGKR